VEVLIPDFCGKKENLEILFKSEPDVISHNLDTTQPLFPEIRPSSNYGVSLSVLKEIKKNGFISKSSFMLGLGENPFLLRNLYILIFSEKLKKKEKKWDLRMFSQVLFTEVHIWQKNSFRRTRSSD